MLFPSISIVLLITLLAPIYSISANLRHEPVRLLKQYVATDLPRMGSEVVLFLTAGIFGSGLASLFDGTVLTIGPEHNSLLLVIVGLVLILALSVVGIHSVVGISIVSGGLVAADIPPDLLAMCFLMGWGIGNLINPISGIHLLWGWPR